MENMAISLIFGLTVFIIVYLFIKVFFEMRSTLESRLQAIERLGGDRPREKKKRADKKSSERKIFFRLGKKLEKDLENAGLKMDPENFMLIWLLCAAGPGMAGFLFMGNPVFGTVFLAAGLIAPKIYLSMCRSKRIALFSSQLGDALMVISNCLRSGLSIKQAMQRVTEDMPDPLRGEFQKAIVKLDYGASLDDVLREIADNMENRDMTLLNAAIGLNQKVGGSLADILDTVVGTIRERIQIRQQLKVLTAMGRISGWIIGLMPVFMLAYFMLVNPEYMGWFFVTPAGNITLAAAAVWELIGILAVRKIVNIKL